MKRRRIAVFFLLMCGIPGILVFGFHVFAAPQYIKAPTRILGGLSNLCGPWATIVAKPSGWPNAGEFFSLPLAVAGTAALAIVVTASLVTRKKWVRVVCLSVSPALVLSWYAVGLIQLMCCAV